MTQKATHRIIELSSGEFSVERYAPWHLFGIEIPSWESYQEKDFEIGHITSYRRISFQTQPEVIEWLKIRFGPENVVIDNILARLVRV